MTSLCRYLSAQGIVNWVTTAHGCVHTADTDATKEFRPVGVGGVYWALHSAVCIVHINGLLKEHSPGHITKSVNSNPLSFVITPEARRGHYSIPDLRSTIHYTLLPD